VDKANEIGENTFLKLRQQRDQARSECDQAKIQRDVALRKLNKALQIAKDLRKLVERSFCGRWGAKGVKDTYVCHEWRKRYFKR